MRETTFEILAARCGDSGCGCGCPTIMQAGDDVVIVGDGASRLIEAASVRERIGEGEAAVVIPRALLVEALANLRQREAAL
ncbi:hypothetical protein Rvan_0852 [Rhodomicrobium vannielii ATCC 17100]|uniref:Uncharacterized protein n=1 Tax=Rhodomicrobium vannielii (strain ATCC 17100 / DSM 162 / LMG 4299 / NCIMB 10020 / ATH 3.1.1) TaxID=648757 RepID=E3I1Q9_RHOVT|nr:hypothetical protein [Rhodomicrobium vannielii]ADP70128.1 hypothetical protein Rvan_0852 [Rhodomicrobium vannielii ATCC 17100]